MKQGQNNVQTKKQKQWKVYKLKKKDAHISSSKNRCRNKQDVHFNELEIIPESFNSQAFSMSSYLKVISFSPELMTLGFLSHTFTH